MLSCIDTCVQRFQQLVVSGEQGSFINFVAVGFCLRFQGRCCDHETLMNRWNQILDFDSKVCRRGLRRNDSILRLNVLSFYMKRNLARENLDSKLPPVICGDPFFSASGSGNYGRAGEDFFFGPTITPETVRLGGNCVAEASRAGAIAVKRIMSSNDLSCRSG